MKSLMNRNRSVLSRPKKVQFLDFVRVHDIQRFDDYTVLERSQIWIGASEYSIIRKNNRSIVEMIDDGEREEEKMGICFRGLEDKGSEWLHEKRYLKQEALELVLYAQEAQCEELLQGHLDWEPIRAAYLSVSGDCASAAREVGLSDAFNAWSAYQKSPESDVQKLRLSTRTIVQASPRHHRRSLAQRRW